MQILFVFAHNPWHAMESRNLAFVTVFLYCAKTMQIIQKLVETCSAGIIQGTDSTDCIRT